MPSGYSPWHPPGHTPALKPPPLFTVLSLRETQTLISKILPSLQQSKCLRGSQTTYSSHQCSLRTAQCPAEIDNRRPREQTQRHLPHAQPHQPLITTSPKVCTGPQLTHNLSWLWQCPHFPSLLRFTFHPFSACVSIAVFVLRFLFSALCFPFSVSFFLLILIVFLSI